MPKGVCLSAIRVTMMFIRCLCPREGKRKRIDHLWQKGYDGLFGKAVRQSVNRRNCMRLFHVTKILTAVRSRVSLVLEDQCAFWNCIFIKRASRKIRMIGSRKSGDFAHQKRRGIGCLMVILACALPDDSQRLRVWFMQPDGSFTWFVAESTQ